jgi:inorganic pyrophosphatase
VTHPWKGVSPGKNPPEIVTAVVEIPAGSRNKYELDKESGLFKLDRVLYSAVHYPGDYGLIPQTLHQDGDPLDVLVVIKEPTFTGCMIDVRPVGVMWMLDRGEPDDKILAVPVNDPLHGDVHSVDDLPKHLLKEIVHFFAVYKDLEEKRVEVTGWGNADEAKRVIRESIVRYKEQVEGA